MWIGRHTLLAPVVVVVAAGATACGLPPRVDGAHAPGGDANGGAPAHEPEPPSDGADDEPPVEPPPQTDAGPPPTDGDVPPPPGAEGEGEGEGETAPPPPEREVFYTRPTATTPSDTTLEDVLVSLLALAESGSTVRVALYEWDRTAMVAPFLDAAARGVDVRFVLDDTNADNAVVTQLRAALPDAHVTLCGGGSCIGTGINHNKIFLFSALSDGSRDVVVQSSANLRASQLKQHNNMVVARNDAALYAGYLDYWEDLRAQQSNADYYRSVDGDDDAHDYPLRAFFFPRAAGDGDTVDNALELVSCDGGGAIHVAMAYFTDARVAIARELARLKGDGCSVRVVIRDAGDPAPGADVLTTLRNAGIETVLFPHLSDNRTLHSKLLLIDARYNGSVERRKIAFTGSHNWTGGALNNNDETLLRVEDDALYARFFEHWQAIRADLP